MSKIKVLWFSINPAAGDEYIGSNGTGGWMKSLDKAIQDKIELHVAFYHRRFPAEFKVGKTTYHQIAPYDKKTLVFRRIKKTFGQNPDLPRYLKVIEKVKPDIIHIHGTESPFIQLAKYTDVPVVLSIQAIMTAICHKYYIGIRKNNLPLLSKYRTTYRGFLKDAQVERDNMKYISYVLGRTDWDRRFYSIIAPRVKYYSCDEILRDGFYNADWTEPRNNKIIIHTTTSGLLFKGVETICEAARELDRIGLDFEWRIAGISKNAQVVRAINKKTKNEYPKERIVFLGALSENDLISKMLEAHIYVSPSHQDNSSNALCEAMMLGLPCIGTYAGGTGSMMTDRKDGILIQDGDPWVMAGAVLELANDRNLASFYGMEAKKTASHRHDKQRVVESVLEIYQDIFSKSK